MSSDRPINGNVSRFRVYRVEQDLESARDEIKENRRQLAKLAADVSALKAELRIFSVLILGALAALIGIILQQVIP